MLRSYLSIILIALICTRSTLGHEYHKHECVHDNLNFVPVVDANNRSLGEYNTRDHVRRVLQSSTWTPIRIAADYSGLTGVDPTTLDFIQSSFFPNVINFFQSALQVIQLSPTLTVAVGTQCPNLTVSTSVTANADLYLYVTYTYDNTSNWVAWASSCQLSGINYRPIVGQVNLNLAHFDSSQAEYQTNVVKHETTHVLAFNKALYSYWINPLTNQPLGLSNVMLNTTIRGLTSSLIVTPKVAALAQQYFNCPSYPGLELENQGPDASIGTHWETRVVADEVMVAAAPFIAYYSPFTAALLEDSGWYIFNYSYTLSGQWGKNKGCGFVNDMCVSVDSSGTAQSLSSEFCADGGTGGCTFNGRYKALCYTMSGTPETPLWNYFGDDTISGDSFSDNCPDMIGYSNGDCRDTTNNMNLASFEEYYGEYGRCFEGTFVANTYAMLGNNPNYGCFESHCTQNSDGSWNLQVTIGSGLITCPQAGGTASVTDLNYQGYVTCPPANQVCVYTCPNNCSKNGLCMDGVCRCYGTWGGVDCSVLGGW